MVGCPFPLLSYVFSAVQLAGGELTTPAGKQLLPLTPNPRTHSGLRQENQSTPSANSAPDRPSLSVCHCPSFGEQPLAEKIRNRAPGGASRNYIDCRYSRSAADILRKWFASFRGGYSPERVLGRFGCTKLRFLRSRDY